MYIYVTDKSADKERIYGTDKSADKERYNR